jgi:hypothetical protein
MAVARSVRRGAWRLYSYDWIEKLIGMPVHSATRIDPALQHLAVGDRIRYTPEGYPLDMEYEVSQWNHRTCWS